MIQFRDVVPGLPKGPTNMANAGTNTQTVSAGGTVSGDIYPPLVSIRALEGEREGYAAKRAAITDAKSDEAKRLDGRIAAVDAELDRHRVRLEQDGNTHPVVGDPR